MKTLQGDAIRNITGQFGSYVQFREDEIQGCFTKFDGGRGGDFGAITHYNPNGCVFNANLVVPTANEIRPNNFNIKLYVKV